MEIETRLSERQKQDLEELLKDCQKKEKQKIDFFMEQEWNEIPECPCFFLTYENGQLVCAVSIFLVDHEAEVSAVTRYEKRKKEFLHNTMKKVREVLDEYGIDTVSFRIDSENETARQVLEHWKSQKQQTECLMVLSKEQERKADKICENQEEELFAWILPKGKKKGKKEIKSAVERMAHVHASAFHCQEEDSRKFLKENLLEGAQLWEYRVKKKTVGVCMITESMQNYFFSAIGILKEEQGKGKSFSFLTEVIENLWRKEKKSIFLQVELENIPAVKVYQKLGFSMQQQMTEYLVFLDKIHYN